MNRVLYCSFLYPLIKIVSVIKGLQEEKDIIDPDESNQVESYMKKVKGIRDVLARNNMKVVFFGRQVY